jgi:hypothetical protein
LLISVVFVVDIELFRKLHAFLYRYFFLGSWELLTTWVLLVRDLNDSKVVLKYNITLLIEIPFFPPV